MPYYDTAVLMAYRLPPWSAHEERSSRPRMPAFAGVRRWFNSLLPPQSKRSTA